MNEVQTDAVEEVVEETTEAPSTEETETPKETTEEVATEETTEEATETEEETLYELPDGRKVDAETLQTEWKENFLPDYTKKSQRIAEIDKNITNEEPEWKKEGYVPKSYREVIEIAKEAALDDIKAGQEKEQERVKAVQTQVDTQLQEIKKENPKLDENALFQHANRYGFQDLKSAYGNMKDMKKVVETTQQKTVQNLKNRENDGVATNSGEVATDNAVDINEIQSTDPLEFFRNLNKK